MTHDDDDDGLSTLEILLQKDLSVHNALLSVLFALLQPMDRWR